MATARAQADGVPQRSMPGAAAAAKPAAGPLPLRDRRDVGAQPRKPTTAWGDGVVQTKGRVLTPDGKPIAGAQITLWWYAVIGYGWHHHTFPEARPRAPGHHRARWHLPGQLSQIGNGQCLLNDPDTAALALGGDRRRRRRLWPGVGLGRAARPTSMS